MTPSKNMRGRVGKGPVQQEIIKVLREANGELVEAAQLTEAVYNGTSKRRLPSDEVNSLRVSIHRLRKMGVQIECVVGYRIPR
jgi:DNA-binding winged helix-turn-helix (wHTH) protein